jgi:putative exporter of polyketide antibiotics
MLAAWAVVTFVFSGPGWIHLFLTLGVFTLIWGIAARDTRGAERTDERASERAGTRRPRRGDR